MQMIIEIDERDYEWAFNYLNPKTRSEEINCMNLAKIIMEGKVLSKGHGNLVDANTTFIKLNERIHAHDVMTAQYEPYRNNEIPLWMWSALIEDITIIKADKENNYEQ